MDKENEGVVRAVHTRTITKDGNAGVLSSRVAEKATKVHCFMVQTRTVPRCIYSIFYTTYGPEK